MPKGVGSRRGHDRERAIRKQLTEDGWLAFRAPASLGVADVVALRHGERPMLVEVKSSAGGPYERFGPDDRDELAAAAHLAGADAYLVWWPSGGKARWIGPDEWPTRTAERRAA